ncbi:MAG: beta-lactamase family protein [Planctomycetes bacterium]|nr:beta-lactamase family protein [Planctomycetota bacterium]
MQKRGMRIVWVTLSMAGLAVCLWAAGMVALFKLVASPVERTEVVYAPDFDDVSAFSDEDKSRVDAWLQEIVDRAQYPSLSVAVVRDGKIAYQGAFGLDNIEAGRQASSETSYHVASVTKVFTTSLAVILHERGVVDLDEPVTDYLPRNVRISTKPELGATITLRQLASHTSGLPRRVPGKVQSVEGRYELEPQRLYDHLAYVRLAYDPGTDEIYSNLGMGLLGHALERAADKPFDQLVQEMICEPLSLERTAIRVDDKLRMATGYSSSTPRRPEDFSRQRRLAPSGGLVASAEDLAMFLAAQMNPGVFSSDMLKELHTETTLSDGSMATTALGWSVRSRESVGRILKKNGGRNNCSDWIGFAPEHGVGVAVITNCGEPAVDDIGYWLLERSIPGGHRPVTKHGYAKVAPYTGVRWESDRPVVHVRDVWSPLVSINGIPIDRIIEFAEQEYGEIARKRFAEDLVEVLSKMGHEPDWEVTLELKNKDGQIEQEKIRMTERNRALAREYLREMD